jgi:hypothetical protein
MSSLSPRAALVRVTRPNVSYESMDVRSTPGFIYPRGFYCVLKMKQLFRTVNGV